jgi:transcriptional antiterminator NusG
MSSKRWYVVHAYSGHEKKVAASLRERIARAGMEELFGDILVPTEEVVEMRGGQILPGLCAGADGTQ